MKGGGKPQVRLGPLWDWRKVVKGDLASAGKNNLWGGVLFAIFFGARYLLFCQDKPR